LGPDRFNIHVRGLKDSGQLVGLDQRVTSQKCGLFTIFVAFTGGETENTYGDVDAIIGENQSCVGNSEL
jgi:hypothetical protein